MSREDLHHDIQADYDAAHRRWHVTIPLSHIERCMYERGQRIAPGPPATLEGLRRAGVTMGEHIAEVLAKPGRHTRWVRARIAKNNRRRFGTGL